MQQITHPELVRALIKPGEQIQAEMTPFKAMLAHLSAAIPSEAGELADALKKHAFYGGELNMENVIEELGDLEFFMQALRDATGITREQTLEANIAKLAERHKKLTFSNEGQLGRADKQ